MNAFQALLSSESLLPHGFCYLWNPLLLWLHGISDTLIAIAYFSIPPTLIYLVRKKRSIPFDWMFLCFGTFIAACGATHLMEVVTLWVPVYWLSGGVKLLTAMASLPTAILLARVAPQILETPTAQDLRLAHEELKTQAGMLREQAALMELSQDAILVQTIDGKNLLWNQGAERMYGWTKAEAIGENAHKLLETCFPQPFDEIMEKLEKTGYWEGELQKKRRDGQTLIVSSRWALGRASDGRPEKVLVIDTDITEQRRAEAAMRESEDRYRDLVEHSHDLICTHDLEGRLLSVNEQPARILGYSREELVRKPMKEFLLPEGHASFDEYLANIPKTKVAKGAMVVLTRSGERRIWEYHNSLRTDGVATPIVRGIAHDVTERWLAERALRVSEEKFAKAFRCSPSVLSISTVREGRFIDVNEGFEGHSGYTRDEVMGHTAEELRLWWDPRERQAFVEEMEKSGHIRNREVQFRSKSGEQIILMLSAEIIELAGERCLLKFGQDITARKSMEEALRRSEERFRLMADNIEEIFWLLDPKSLEAIYVSPAFEHICERPLISIQEGPTSYREIIHPEDAPQVLGQLALLEKTNELHERFRIVCPSGTVKWLEVWGFTAKDSSGNVTALVGTVQDITERKQAEEARRQSEELLRAAFERVAVGFSVTDVRGRFLRVNEAFCRITGYSEEELLHTNYQTITHPEDLSQNLELGMSLLAGKTSSAVYQKRYIRKSGEPVWVQNSVSVLPDDNGKVSRFVALAEDITERKRAEEGFRKLSGQLLQLQDEERRKIARDLHDVTGQDLVALSSTLGHLQATTPGTNRKSKKVLSQCQTLTDRCIREIRTLSYLLHPPMLDEAGLEDAIRHYMGGFAERTGIDVRLEVSPNFGRLAREEEMALFRVMQESLVNIHRHSGSLSASILLDRTEQKILLQMSDKGRGIRGDGHGRNKCLPAAAGVGIQSMRERMTLVGGQLEIESSSNGTTVRAILPAPS
jgi:PAS domain S-box-containing protein